jgi:hypothetical protein
MPISPRVTFQLRCTFSLLNEEYINDGYYIFINNDMISIFYLKEEYRNIESLDKIKELNEKILNNFQLN